jgi:serine/threonine protein kinase
VLQGVVNRDIKLENTLLDSSPRPLVKICDFGYSKVNAQQMDRLEGMRTPHMQHSSSCPAGRMPCVAAHVNRTQLIDWGQGACCVFVATFSAQLA